MSSDLDDATRQRLQAFIDQGAYVPLNPNAAPAHVPVLPQPGVNVHLVVMDRDDLFGVYLDEDRAREAARNIKGLLVTLPVTEDYRRTGESGPG